MVDGECYAISMPEAIRTLPATTQRKRPRSIPKDQEWFWSKEWQAGEREVDEALARGEYEEFDSLEDLFANLHQHVSNGQPRKMRQDE